MVPVPTVKIPAISVSKVSFNIACNRAVQASREYDSSNGMPCEAQMAVSTGRAELSKRKALRKSFTFLHTHVDMY